MDSRPSALSHIAPPTAVVRRDDSLRLFRAALPSLGGFVLCLAFFIALGYIGVLGSLLATCTMSCLALVASRSPAVRRGLDDHMASCARQLREEERRSALATVTPDRRQQYVDLLVLAEHIERSDPAEATRNDLEQLLDYFVQLSCGYQRCLESLRVSPTIGSTSATPDVAVRTLSPRHDEIVARRTRHRDESSARLARIVDEIGATDELIRLLAQRVAYARLAPIVDLEIDRRLAELDDYDAALEQLSA